MVNSVRWFPCHDVDISANFSRCVATTNNVWLIADTHVSGTETVIQISPAMAYSTACCFIAYCSIKCSYDVIWALLPSPRRRPILTSYVMASLKYEMSRLSASPRILYQRIGFHCAYHSFRIIRNEWPLKSSACFMSLLLNGRWCRAHIMSGINEAYDNNSFCGSWCAHRPQSFTLSSQAALCGAINTTRSGEPEIIHYA